LAARRATASGEPPGRRSPAGVAAVRQHDRTGHQARGVAGQEKSVISIRLDPTVADELAELSCILPTVSRSRLLEAIIGRFLEGEMNDQLIAVEEALGAGDALGRQIRRLAGYSLPVETASEDSHYGRHGGASQSSADQTPPESADLSRDCPVATNAPLAIFNHPDQAGG
jgi:hypothetical protein